MAGTAEEVLEAAAVFGAAHARWLAARDQAERVCEDLQNKVLQKAFDLFEDDDDEHEIDESDARVQAIQRYVFDGDAGDLDPQCLGEFDALRWKHLPRIELADEACRQVETTLRAPQANFVRELRAWHARARGGDGASLDEWPAILHAWRVASDRTTREAAVDLEISPSTIVRYENGSRTASAQYVAAMIERIEAAQVVSDTPLRALYRLMARLLPDGTDATARIEMDEHEADALKAALEAEIEDCISGLNLERLKVVAAIVRDRRAIDALLEWSRRPGDPLQPVLDVLSAAG